MARLYTIEGNDCTDVMQRDLYVARGAAKSKIVGACGFFGAALGAYIVGYIMIIAAAASESFGMIGLGIVLLLSIFVFAAIGGVKLTRAIKKFNQVRRLQNIVAYIKNRKWVNLNECSYTRKYVKESCLLVEGLIELGHLAGFVVDKNNCTVYNPQQNGYQRPQQAPYQTAYQAPYQTAYQAPQMQTPPPVQPAPAQSAAGARFCPNCGAAATEGSYCFSCGEKIR